MYYLRRFPLTCCCIALIWYLCLFKPPSTPLDSVSGIDKVAHIVMYLGTCGVFWAEYFRSPFRLSRRSLLGIAVAAPIAMSGVVELCQKYLTDCRSGEWADFAANTLGVLSAALLAAIWRHRHRMR
ncbi:MAG: hypothetical protein ACI3YD_04220 [Alloprevotella sp.]